ncbi:MAG: septum formation inhibitor Maf [Flavobacteriaceae bacterium]|nr:septum formation inhibitor Maf [Flavobacteriaceae bacterium]
MIMRFLKFKFPVLLSFGLLILISGCSNGSKDKSDTGQELVSTDESPEPVVLSDEFKAYWYAGEAELTSYKLEQVRYGEIRDGHAVLIYVTEDFNPEKQVKADNARPENVSVLKLNATKNFNTGIYPYSIMQSSFYPVSNNQHAIKVSGSIQEWCGHVYAQINNREDYEVMSHSYFESEADQDFNLDKAPLENEIWNQLRIDPNSLPQGEIEMIPSLEFLRLKHVEIKPYTVTATLSEGTYMLDYKGLNRTLTITFNPDFPYSIEGWEETIDSGFGADAKALTTRATKMAQLKSPYWARNSNADADMRKTLMLE